MRYVWFYSIEGADGTTADYEVTGRYEAEARLRAQARWQAERPHEPIIWIELVDSMHPEKEI